MQKSNERYVLDSHALITYFKQEPGWNEVELLLTGTDELLMSLINWGEIYYTRIVYAGNEAAEIAARNIENLGIAIVAPDLAMTRLAAEFKALGGISSADCFAAALAASENATLVTGDKEFKKLEKKGLVKIKWI